MASVDAPDYFPRVLPSDAPSVANALAIADACWRSSDFQGAVNLIRRAANFAGDADDDDRMLALLKTANDLVAWVEVYVPKQPALEAPVTSAAPTALATPQAKAQEKPEKQAEDIENSTQKKTGRMSIISGTLSNDTLQTLRTTANTGTPLPLAAQASAQTERKSMPPTAPQPVKPQPPKAPPKAPPKPPPRPGSRPATGEHTVPSLAEGVLGVQPSQPPAPTATPNGPSVPPHQAASEPSGGQSVTIPPATLASQNPPKQAHASDLNQTAQASSATSPSSAEASKIPRPALKPFATGSLRSSQTFASPVAAKVDTENSNSASSPPAKLVASAPKAEKNTTQDGDAPNPLRSSQRIVRTSPPPEPLQLDLDTDNKPVPLSVPKAPKVPTLSPPHSEQASSFLKSLQGQGAEFLAAPAYEASPKAALSSQENKSPVKEKTDSPLKRSSPGLYAHVTPTTQPKVPESAVAQPQSEGLEKNSTEVSNPSSQPSLAVSLSSSGELPTQAQTKPFGHLATTNEHLIVKVNKSAKSTQTSITAQRSSAFEFESLADIPDDLRLSVLAEADITTLLPEEEISAPALIVVLKGEVDVRAEWHSLILMTVQTEQVRMFEGVTPCESRFVLRGGPRGTRFLSLSSAQLDALRSKAPWFTEDHANLSQDLHAVAGVLKGTLGQTLDGPMLELVLQRTKSLRLKPNTIVVKAGESVRSLVLVGGGQLHMQHDSSANLSIFSQGDVVLPRVLLEKAPAPANVLAGPHGALVRVGTRNATEEVLMNCPPLLEALASA